MSSAEPAVEPPLSVSREEYRAWAEQQPQGRFERMNGIVVAMAPERSGHNQRKMLAWLALRQAVRTAGLTCQVYGDGMTVEVGDSDYEPDVILHCGPALPDDAVAVPDPLVIVEVLSPSTSGVDRVWKLAEYFKLPSLHHYLVVWPDQRQIVHHRRNADGSIGNTVITAGDIVLDPPGITVAVDGIYSE